jgi:hypothetical protein
MFLLLTPSPLPWDSKQKAPVGKEEEDDDDEREDEEENAKSCDTIER